MLPVLPPSTGILTPLTYEPAGEARKAATAAISDGSPNRFMGISFFIDCSTLSLDAFAFFAEASMTKASRCVSMFPGKRLLTVILNCPSSLAIVFAHEATAPRIVLDTPKFFNGILTVVEMILMIRPVSYTHLRAHETPEHL